MTKLHHEITIKAPVEKVWQVLTDLESVQHYNPGVAKAYYVSPNKEGVGSTRQCDYKGAGPVKERVVALEENKSITMEAYDHQWPVKSLKWRTELKSQGETTRMVQDLEYEFTGNPKDASVMEAQYNQGVTAVFEGLKQFVEKQ